MSYWRLPNFVSHFLYRCQQYYHNLPRQADYTFQYRSCINMEEHQGGNLLKIQYCRPHWQVQIFLKWINYSGLSAWCRIYNYYPPYNHLLKRMGTCPGFDMLKDRSN